MSIDKKKYISGLRRKFESYAPVSDNSWELIQSLIQFRLLKKGEFLLMEGEFAKNVYYICKGALRAYITDPKGDIYNKNIFLERDFAGSKVSLLQGIPSYFTLEALENSVLISLDYKHYRTLIRERKDLTNFYISYLERNWVIDKEQIEVSLVLENATERYLKFLKNHPDIDSRIPQRHIASHLGITPTQLSRIRKKLKK